METAQDAPAATGTVFLLMKSGVMTQLGGTRLWHAVEAEPDVTSGGPTAAQLRALRRERARRQHPAGSALRRPAARAATVGSGKSPARFEVFDSLRGCWSPVPPTPGPSQVADALCWVLPDGRLLVGGLSSRTYSTYDPASRRWTTTHAAAEGGDTSLARRGTRHAPVVVVRLSD